MAAARALAARVARLERASAPSSPFGDLDAWEARCRAAVAAGELDRLDVPVVILAVRRWHADGWYARRSA